MIVFEIGLTCRRDLPPETPVVPAPPDMDGTSAMVTVDSRGVELFCRFRREDEAGHRFDYSRKLQALGEFGPGDRVLIEDGSLWWLSEVEPAPLADPLTEAFGPGVSP